MGEKGHRVSHATNRLLVVTESLGIGGTETHLFRLLPRLAASGWEITTFCLTGRGKRAAELETVGIRVSAPSQVGWAGGSVFRSPTRLAERFASLYSLARRWRPTIGHFYLPGPYLLGAPAAMAAGIPIKIMSRRSSSRYQEARPILARVERILHKKMDGVIGNSEAVVRELRAEDVSEEKLHLIYNGIDLPTQQPKREAARKVLGIESGVLVGVMVANLIHYKGHHDLIRALIHVSERLPSQWTLLLAGRDEGLKSELESLADNGGINRHVRFLGEYSGTAALLAAADFGLLTSHEEGFSNAILEGMAAGLPMIVTDTGGNPEAVLDGTTGLVVPPRNVEAIGDAILRLANDPGLRARLGERGRLRVQNEFSMTRCADAHDQLYRSLIDRLPQRSSQAVSESQSPRPPEVEAI